MTWHLGRGGRLAGHSVLGAVACLALTVGSPVRADTLSTYSECMQTYRPQTDATAYCRRMFPATAPAATTPATPPPATPPATTTPDPGSSQTTPTRTPVDITPQINRWIEGLANRPRTPKPPARPPSDPLAVIPGILSVCAPYAGIAERWRRCTADGWRQAGLRGQPPLVLQTPPAPPPVQEPPAVQEPPVQSRPPPVTPKPPAPPPVKPAPPVVATVPEPPVAVVPPPVTPPPVTPPPPAPPPVVVAPTPPPAAPSEPQWPSIPIWAWLVALAVAAGGGFGVAKLLGRARSVPSRGRAPAPQAAPCAPPEIVLVAHPGVVVLTPEGSPRAGLAISLRFDRAADADEVRLDYPSLETAP